MSRKITEISCNKMFGGKQLIVSHDSEDLKCKMNFAIYLPEEHTSKKLPVLYWLSGLTCDETNFIHKAGAQRIAAEEGIILVCPDTSPRGDDIPDDPDSWDFGKGAGFYLNATREPWNQNYNMYDYVTKELIQVVNENFPVLIGQQSIFGHSMGGHGALICALKNPGLYKSVSAFSPICNPSKCPWGKKAFSGYLDDEKIWAEWDATELACTYDGPELTINIDQGTDDNFFQEKQLLPGNILVHCKNPNLKFNLTMREGYDHSYFFIATFVEEHIKYHASQLK